MNKKALLGLAVALLLPLCCYLLLKYASESAADMPRRFLLDTTVTRVVNGKEITDSIWHTTANIHLQNQLGDSVSLYDKPGKILVVDLFFTSCGSICPRLTANMSKLQQSFLGEVTCEKK
jgi:protein SCO1/2